MKNNLLIWGGILVLSGVAMQAYYIGQIHKLKIEAGVTGAKSKLSTFQNLTLVSAGVWGAVMIYNGYKN